MTISEIAAALQIAQEQLKTADGEEWVLLLDEIKSYTVPLAAVLVELDAIDAMDESVNQYYARCCVLSNRLREMLV